MNKVNWAPRWKSVKIFIKDHLSNIFWNKGIEMHETVSYPTKIPSDKLKGKKVVDFDISENTGIILTGKKTFSFRIMRFILYRY